jgi:hypothetical protein
MEDRQQTLHNCEMQLHLPICEGQAVDAPIAEHSPEGLTPSNTEPIIALSQHKTQPVAMSVTLSDQRGVQSSMNGLNT